MVRAVPTLAALTMLLLVIVAAPAVGGGGGNGCAGFSDGRAVVVRDVCLDGAAHFLPPGSGLTVINAGQLAHDYVAVDGAFRTGVLQPGERATIEQPPAGVHRVHCTLHASADGRGMAGVLVVGEQDSGTSRLPVAGVALGLALVALALRRRPRLAAGAGAVDPPR